MTATSATAPALHDWRQLTVPDAPLPPGAYCVVVSLYNPQTGARWICWMKTAPAGQELTVATLQPAPPPAGPGVCVDSGDVWGVSVKRDA
ncbi:MAG: hypothetical protein R3A10_12395 [Caldilineaceae bacterium]